jgi:hypothetical protein
MKNPWSAIIQGLLSSASRFVGIIFVISGTALGQKIPAGCTIPDFTSSPDHRYGVTVPQNDSEVDNQNAQNELIELKTGHVLAAIKGDTGWDHGGWAVALPSRWSQDGTFLLWHVDGKWSPSALVLLRVHDNAVNWQIDLLNTAQQAILARTKNADPIKYAAAKKQNSGNGSAYPDGFTVDVYVDGKDGDPLSLPLTVHANLTSNPKQIEGMINLDSGLDAVVDKNGKFTVTKFHLLTPKELEKMEESTDSQ